jgi:hypothetical protein
VQKGCQVTSPTELFADCKHNSRNERRQRGSSDRCKRNVFSKFHGIDEQSKSNRTGHRGWKHHNRKPVPPLSSGPIQANAPQAVTTDYPHDDGSNQGGHRKDESANINSCHEGATADERYSNDRTDEPHDIRDHHLSPWPFIDPGKLGD